MEKLVDEFDLNGKKVAFFDVFDPIPINSGGDWYRYQILNDLSKCNEVSEYFTADITKEVGYFPQDLKFKRILLENGEYYQKLWTIISPKMCMIKPDLYLNNQGLRSINADIIFTIVESYHIAKYVSKINNNAPIILVMHNIEWKYLKANKSSYYLPLKYYENYILRKADAVISISKDCAEYASIHNKNNIYCISPVIHDLFTPYGEKYDYGSDKLNILFYGSLDNEMNIYGLKFIKNELIPLMKSENVLEKVRVNIFGSGKPPAEMNLSQDNEINYLGTVDDPSKYIRGADVVIVPLENGEGIKIRIIESLGCNKTVIATPNAVKNLQKDLKDKIIVKKDVNGFLDVIKCLVNPTAVGYNG